MWRSIEGSHGRYGNNATLFSDTITTVGPFSIANVQTSVTSERTTAGFSRIEFLINGASLVPPVQSGYQSEDAGFAPNLCPMTINWTGPVTIGQVLSIVAQSSNGIANLTGGNFPTAVGSQFTVLLM